jgi:hypothetical protein
MSKFKLLPILSAFVLIAVAGLVAEKYDDTPYEVWEKKQTNIFPGLARPQTLVSWETYQFQSLLYQWQNKLASDYKTTIKLDDRNDVPGKIVNFYKGQYLVGTNGAQNYYFHNDEVWFFYFPRAFPGVLLVVRDESTDGLIVKGEDKDGRLDGIGYMDKDGYHELDADFLPDTKTYEFQIPDGRWAQLTQSWYLQSFRDVIKVNINGLARWYDFGETIPNFGGRGYATDVGFNPRTGLSSKPTMIK